METKQFMVIKDVLYTILFIAVSALLMFMCSEFLNLCLSKIKNDNEKIK